MLQYVRTDTSFDNGTVTILDEETDTVSVFSNRKNAVLSDMNSELSPSTASFSVTKKIIAPDIRSDIYSVGATLYHLLSGKRPSQNVKDIPYLCDTGK